MKKSEKTNVAANTTVIAQPTVEKKAPGRPVVAGSARQQRMEARQKLIDAGLMRKGRPVVTDSPRQQKLAKIAAKIAAGIAPKPGRPAYNAEQKAASDAAKAAKKAAEKAAIEAKLAEANAAKTPELVEA